MKMTIAYVGPERTSSARCISGLKMEIPTPSGSNIQLT